jgi:hypothetical protein
LGNVIKSTNMTAKKIVVNSELSSGSLRSLVTVSKDLRKYFSCYHFVSSYDTDIIAHESILNIPILSIVLPLAWISGADVYVNELDEVFTESVELLQNEYKKIYPKAPFETKLFVNKLVRNEYISPTTALLFSGGLDATYSLYKNIANKPQMVMIFGTDIPISNVKYQELVNEEYSGLARREGLTINFIRTNALEILNTRRVDYLFWKYKERLEGDFWKGIGYAFGHIGQAAPLSIGNFSRLLIAAWADKTIARNMKEHPDSSSPNTDEKIAWANLVVKHDGCLHRFEKLKEMKEFLLRHKLKLRVCWDQPLFSDKSSEINCSKCEKCLRTITSLALVGIDPIICGFKVNEETLAHLEALFKKKKLTPSHLAIWWKPIQQIIPDHIEGNLFGLKKFFTWFKQIDLDSVSRSFCPPLSVRGLYYIFPYSISIFVRKILYFPFEK